MSVDINVLKDFINVTNDAKPVENKNVYGTIVTDGNKQYVKIDGSEIRTPFRSTTDVKNNERVMVNINNHMAIVTNNLSDPSAGGDRVNNAEGKIDYFDHLFAGNITAENIKANSITAEKILAGTITADKLQAGTITAGSGVIADGAIGNAQISTLDAGRISSGTIDTSKIVVAGSNGNLTLRGNRLQVFEGIGSKQFERVSLGDVDNDGETYGLRVRGKDGTTVLYDENGVYEQGITDGSITNDKIKGEANIDGAKLNISSVIRKINEDDSETISGLKINVDNESLNATLNKINTVQTEQTQKISTNTANIAVNAEKINLKVDEQIYQENLAGMTSKLDKHTADITVMKEGISLSATKTEVTNQIKTSEDGTKKYVNDSITTYDAGLKVKFDNINLSVSETTSGLNSANVKIAAIDVKADGISSRVSGLDGKYTELKQTVDGIDIDGVVTFNDLEFVNSSTVINGGNIKTDSISLKTLKSNDADPILKLFPSSDGGYCSIDATVQYETGGRGNAIRLKWDRGNYVLVRSGMIDFYLNGNAKASVNSAGLVSNGSQVSVEGHSHSGYASSGHQHDGDYLYPDTVSTRALTGSGGGSILMHASLDGNNKNLGWSASRFNQVVAAAVWADTGSWSDVRLKENIHYLNEVPPIKSTLTIQNDESKTPINQDDLYDFIKNDLNLATYNYIPEYSNDVFFDRINFIADDIVNTKIGSILCKEHENYLTYSLNNYVSIIAGALQSEILKREKVESEVNDIKQQLNELKALMIK